MKKYLIVFIALLAIIAIPTVAVAQTGFGIGVTLIEQGSTPATPPSGEVTVFVDNTATPILKHVDDAGTVTSLSSGSGNNTLDDAYDQGSAGAGKAITVDSGAVALSNTEADANALLTISNVPATAAAAEGIVITIGTNSTGAALEFENSGSGYDIEGTAGWSIDKAGVAIFAGLTAATFSPGAITASGTFTLVDDTTDSPSFVMTDATGESATLIKTDGSHLTMTITAADAFQVLTGNLRVGNASPDETHNGEDVFIEGILEVDGEATFDGTLECDGALNVAGATGFSENVTFTMAADEYMLLDAATTDMTGTQGALDINFDSLTTNASAVNIKATLLNNTGNEEVMAIFIDLDDDSDAAAELAGIVIDATDTTGSSNIFGIAFQAQDGSATGVEECIHAETPAGGKYLVLDAATVDSTQTAGVIDIDFDTLTTAAMAFNLKTTLLTAAGAGVEVTGMYLDVDDDSNSASTVTAITIDSTDATGSSEVRGIAFETLAGADTLLDTCIYAETDADTVVLSVDASLAYTGTGGLIDIEFSSVTNGAEVINIDVDVGDTQAGSEVITGILIDLDDDTSSQTSIIRGFSAISSDLTGEASTLVQGFFSSGCDVAAQYDNGYVRIGTGATPGITPGDDDLFVEGTVEIDGELQTDGSIDVNGTIVGAGTTATTIQGMTSIVEDFTGADNVIAIAESGSTFTNSGDADGSGHTLPEASTCVGAEFTFLIVTAQTMTVTPEASDIILHLSLSTGDAISSSTANDSIVLRAVSASQWMVVTAYPTAADWADAN